MMRANAKSKRLNECARECSNRFRKKMTENDYVYVKALHNKSTVAERDYDSKSNHKENYDSW